MKMVHRFTEQGLIALQICLKKILQRSKYLHLSFVNLYFQPESAVISQPKCNYVYLQLNSRSEFLMVSLEFTPPKIFHFLGFYSTLYRVSQ